MKKSDFGYVKITVPREYRNAAMNALLINNLPYKNADILSDYSLEIVIRASNVEKIKSIFEDNAIEASFGKTYGAIAYIARYKGRWGLLLGILFVLFSVHISSLFLWRIDIKGNTSVSNEEILEILDASGCSLGSFVPSINYDELHNKFLMKSENISWISVNITGNVATVLVRERKSEQNENKATYSNVVSKYDAQIALIQLYDGKKTVSVGDVVKKGELLISGVIDSKSQGVRYVNADGIVMGYVNKLISVDVPLKSHQKAYTGKVFEEKSVKFFSKTINFSTKYNNSIEFCDKIKETKRVMIFNSIELPIEITTTYYKEYELQEITYNYSEAIDIAFSKLRVELDTALNNAELISKTVNTYYDDECFYIDCNLYCLENIADSVKFNVEEK